MSTTLCTYSEIDQCRCGMKKQHQTSVSLTSDIHIKRGNFSNETPRPIDGILTRNKPSALLGDMKHNHNNQHPGSEPDFECNRGPHVTRSHKMRKDLAPSRPSSKRKASHAACQAIRISKDKTQKRRSRQRTSMPYEL